MQKVLKKHVKNDHNLWNYLYFLVYLHRKDATEYTGLESFISEMIEEKDWSFMPHLQAMVLSKPLGEEDKSATLAEKLIQLNKETKKKIGQDIKGGSEGVWPENSGVGAEIGDCCEDAGGVGWEVGGFDKADVNWKSKLKG